MDDPGLRREKAGGRPLGRLVTGVRRGAGAARRHFRSWWRHWLASIIVVVLIAVAVAIGLAPLEPQETVSSVTAQTEILSVRADDSGQDQILLTGGRLRVEGGDEPACRSGGVFKPEEGALLTVSRMGDEDLAVRILPSSKGVTGRVDDGAQIRSAVYIVFPNNRSCGARGKIRIPISGDVQIGSDYKAQVSNDEPSETLISGRVSIFARATDKLHGVDIPFAEHAVYPAGLIDLPPGARLSECLAIQKGGPPATRHQWLGYAEARLGTPFPTDRNLDVVLTTDAPRLALTTARGNKTQGAQCANDDGSPSSADVISPSLVARIVNDPNLAAIGVAAGVLLIFLQTLLAIASLEKLTVRPKSKT